MILLIIKIIFTYVLVSLFAGFIATHIDPDLNDSKIHNFILKNMAVTMVVFFACAVAALFMGLLFLIWKV